MLAAQCATLTASLVIPAFGSQQISNTSGDEREGAVTPSAATIERIDSAYGVNGCSSKRVRRGQERRGGFLGTRPMHGIDRASLTSPAVRSRLSSCSDAI